MPQIEPFDALLFDPEVAGPIDRVTAPPYDVIDDTRRRGYLEASPHSIVHVDLADGVDDPSVAGNRYARAAGLLRGWRDRGVLRHEPRSYYAYEMTFADPQRGTDRRIFGVVCAMDLEDWGGRILPHEQVMQGPVDDRLELLRATRTHLSAVYGTVRGPHEEMAAALREIASSPPSFALRDREGVGHRMWRVDAAVPFAEWIGQDRLLIADGHHRYTTALAYRDERRGSEGPGPWDRVLAFVVDSATEHVPVLPYHRIQRAGPTPGGGTPVDDLSTLLGELDDDRGTIGVVTAKGGDLTYRRLHVPGGPPTVRSLHEWLLDGLAPDEDLAFTHEVIDAIDAVKEGAAVAAYLLPATTPTAILSVVERGERLPRKSTFFWPKPRTGMVLMPLDP